MLRHRAENLCRTPARQVRCLIAVRLPAGNCLGQGGRLRWISLPMGRTGLHSPGTPPKSHRASRQSCRFASPNVGRNNPIWSDIALNKPSAGKCDHELFPSRLTSGTALFVSVASIFYIHRKYACAVTPQLHCRLSLAPDAPYPVRIASSVGWAEECRLSASRAAKGCRAWQAAPFPDQMKLKGMKSALVVASKTATRWTSSGDTCPAAFVDT